MATLQQVMATIAILVASAANIVVVVEAAVADIATAEFFNSIKSQAANECPGKEFYRHDAFLEAANAYPDFGNLASAVAGFKHEIAAFFAHVTHETGSMCSIEENDKSNAHCDYPEYPCAPGKAYYGRGPIQLTGNYNYMMCGQANNFDGVGNPDIVARDPVLAWKTALWFWMMYVRPILPQGFGATIRKINSGECDGGRPDQVQDRVNYYIAYCQRFGIQAENNPGC